MFNLWLLIYKNIEKLIYIAIISLISRKTELIVQ